MSGCSEQRNKEDIIHYQVLSGVQSKANNDGGCCLSKGLKKGLSPFSRSSPPSPLNKGRGIKGEGLVTNLEFGNREDNSRKWLRENTQNIL